MPSGKHRDRRTVTIAIVVLLLMHLASAVQPNTHRRVTGSGLHHRTCDMPVIVTPMAAAQRMAQAIASAISFKNSVHGRQLPIASATASGSGSEHAAAAGADALRAPCKSRLCSAVPPEA